ncbi:hypothetical protein HO133_002922 [Letharia lupina]|uniref:Uncharacterized protein n=1 Tax=Letharia lupina TaxID=560253 RepID=A0A8H6FAC8_9LECA|nr:uncharacterized protein HO133_002922 [Letharia lupina]KAF6220489.1 hypothetical protein HO133_002922 [Letharia lupina]
MPRPSVSTNPTSRAMTRRGSVMVSEVSNQVSSLGPRSRGTNGCSYTVQSSTTTTVRDRLGSSTLHREDYSHYESGSSRDDHSHYPICPYCGDYAHYASGSSLGYGDHRATRALGYDSDSSDEGHVTEEVYVPLVLALEDRTVLDTPLDPPSLDPPLDPPILATLPGPPSLDPPLDPLSPDTPALDPASLDTLALDPPSPDTPALDPPSPDTPALDPPSPDTPALDPPSPDTPAPDIPAPDNPPPQVHQGSSLYMESDHPMRPRSADTPAPDIPAPDNPPPQVHPGSSLYMESDPMRPRSAATRPTTVRRDRVDATLTLMAAGK